MTILSDGIEATANAEAEFIEALGGDPEDDHPFGQETDQDRDIPEELYIQHDQELLQWLRRNLTRKPLGMFSPLGTGKTTLSLIVEREFPEKYLIVALRGDNRNRTKRQVCELILRSAFEEGYEIDESKYTQLRDGVPHATSEAEQAVEEVLDQIDADDRTLIFIIDQVEKCDPALFDVFQELGDKGAALLLTGTPAGEDHLKEASVRAGNVEDTALYDRLEIYPDHIKDFEPEHIKAFFARAFAYASDGRLTPEDAQQFFTDDAIATAYDATGGRPRLVRLLGQNVFLRAAEEYAETDELDTVKITAEDVRAEAEKNGRLREKLMSDGATGDETEA